MKTYLDMIMELIPVMDDTCLVRKVLYEKDIKVITEYLNLDNLSVLDLRNLRNTVVLLFSSLKAEKREEQDWEAFDSLNDKESKIETCIDLILMKEPS